MSVTIISGVSCGYPTNAVTCVGCNARFDHPYMYNYRQICFEIDTEHGAQIIYRCHACDFIDCIFVTNASERVVHRLEMLLVDAVEKIVQTKEPIEKVVDYIDRADFMKQLEPPVGCNSCLIKGIGKILCECNRVIYCSESCRRSHANRHKDDCLRYQTYPIIKTMRQYYTDVIQEKTKQLRHYQNIVADIQVEISLLQNKLN
jgi:hypothetical protein